MKILTVLRSGNEFKIEHLIKIQNMLNFYHYNFELYCLTDQVKKNLPQGIFHIPIEHSWSGWWSKIEVFSIDSDEMFLYMDLDTVITGNLEHMFEQSFDFCPIQDAFHRLRNNQRMGSGLFLFRPNSMRYIYEKFKDDPCKYMRNNYGDGNFIEKQVDLNNCSFLQNVFSNEIFSFKADLCDPPKSRDPDNFIGLPKTSRIVFFHGEPRPDHPKINYLNKGE